MMRKRRFFPAILLLPLLFLLSVALLTARDLLRLRTVDPAVLADDLRRHLETKEAASFTLPDEVRARHEGQTRVFLFGESSLVLSDGLVFPEHLAQFRRDLDVVNLGVNGIDSFSVRRLVEQALAAARPDVIVLYYGHNDYNNAYQGFLLRRYYGQFGHLLRLAYALRDRSQARGVLQADDYSWFSRLMRPRIFREFQRAGLLDLHPARFSGINNLILESFRRNNEAVLRLAAARGIPVVLVTPVGNLRAEPFGDIDTTTLWYRRGIAETRYEKAVNYLKLARDAETLTYDLRAKSPLLDYLRACAGPGVFVLDLERRLEEERFAFGYADFLDYFHFNDRSHRLVAALLAEFLARQGLISAGKGLP